MCGIGGIVRPGGTNARDRAAAQEMLRRLAHRGPDGSGLVERPAGALLAHTRLAIIDLEGGAQPMCTEDGATWIVYNGEIYNHASLRIELEEQGRRFRTRSDTEVILQLFQQSGIEGFRRLKGMFAFAIWNDETRQLVLVRDTLGIKPLHYALVGDTLIFASEAKGVIAHPDVKRLPDLQALHDMLNLRFVPSPLTLWQDVKRLEPGHVITWRDGKFEERQLLSVPSFERAMDPPSLDDVQAVLGESVERHLVSDVPVGAYLSAGLDSSMVALLASRMTKEPLNAFTLGFGDVHDEVDAAADFARSIGAAHFSENLEPECLLTYPTALWHMEEPQVNILQSYRVAALARKRLKVVLSGLGGDEIFGGYHSHRWMATLRPLAAIERPFEPLLAPVRRMLAGLQAGFGPGSDLWRRGAQLMLACGRPEEAWGILRNVWDMDPAARHRFYGPQAPPFASALRHVRPLFEGRSFLEGCFDADIRLKLSDDFLAGEDRMSMAHGLEVRPPFLDLDLLAVVRRLPASVHVQMGQGKAWYRRLAERALPPEIMKRKKWGFAFAPEEQWRRSIEPYVKSRLTPENLDRLSPVSPAFIRGMMEAEGGAGLNQHRFILWMLAGYIDWHRIFIENDGARPTEAIAS